MLAAVARTEKNTSSPWVGARLGAPVGLGPSVTGGWAWDGAASARPSAATASGNRDHGAKCIACSSRGRPARDATPGAAVPRATPCRKRPFLEPSQRFGVDFQVAGAEEDEAHDVELPGGLLQEPTHHPQ